MTFVIDGIQPNQKVKKILSEIDSLTEFSGRKPEKVALYPAQFERVKAGCLVALKRHLWDDLRQDDQGGVRRLKPGELQQYLDSNGFSDKESAELIEWKGITLYNKAVNFKEAKQCSF